MSITFLPKKEKILVHKAMYFEHVQVQMKIVSYHMMQPSLNSPPLTIIHPSSTC